MQLSFPTLMPAAVCTSLADICLHGLRFLRNACRGLAHCIDCGTKSLLACVHPMRLGAADPYWKVRTAAMTTLQVLASRRDKRVALACRARLKDGDFNVYGILQKSTDTRHDVRRAHRIIMMMMMMMMIIRIRNLSQRALPD